MICLSNIMMSSISAMSVLSFQSETKVNIQSTQSTVKRVFWENAVNTGIAINSRAVVDYNDPPP